jgi:hypothetical protein
MSRWRKVIDRQLTPSAWLLRLECGHEAFRSAQHALNELPAQVLCQACKALIGRQIQAPVGRVGVISSYRNGKFDISWNNDGVTRSTLDELRETVEIL